MNEIKTVGGKNSTRRTAEQTEIARFWEATVPPICHGVVRSLANVSGREVTQNARLFAAVTQAMGRTIVADGAIRRMLWHNSASLAWGVGRG